MNDPLGINFGLLDQFSLNTHTYASYFFPAANMDLSYCTLPANADSNVAFATDQGLIDSLGNLLDFEAEKLNNISSSFSALEDTLSQLYNPPVTATNNSEAVTLYPAQPNDPLNIEVITPSSQQQQH